MNVTIFGISMVEWNLVFLQQASLQKSGSTFERFLDFLSNI